jgi:hypothetical protein
MVVGVLLVGAWAMAQAPAAPPKPGPEHKRLGYYVGKWQGTGEMKPGPMGPGGKMSWTETCGWFTGRYAIICNSDMRGPMGAGKGHAIMSYNREEKAYVYFGIDTNGATDIGRGSVQDNVWNWTGEGKMGGKAYKIRYSVTETSNDAYTFKFEMSGDGGRTWALVMDGGSSRAK